MSERPPMRGKRGAERRLVERITTEYAERKAKTESTAVDFDVAAVDAEVDDARRIEAAKATANAPSEAARAAGAREASAKAAARPPRRVPDLSALPALLVSTGSFASLRARIGDPASPLPATGRHAGLTTIPHGAKSFLGAALVATGERLAVDRTRLRDRRSAGRGARRIPRRPRPGDGSRAANGAGLRAE